MTDGVRSLHAHAGRGVDVGAEREPRAVMSEHFGECPHVNAVLSAKVANVCLMCFHYTIDEHITAFDFCNLLFRFVFVRNLASRFNQIAHDLIELRGAF